MSLGSESTPMSKTELSAYKIMRRSFGWGTIRPEYWKAGGWFTQLVPPNGGILWQNINSDQRTPATWSDRASSEATAIALIIALGGSS